MKFKHISIHALDKGIYAALHKGGGAAHSNAGIIDLGESTLVFDTFDMPVAARELLTAVLDLTGKPPKWVINSHKHGDHWGGNQVFADSAVIVATHQTRSGMLGWGEELTRLAANPVEIEKRIEQLEGKILNETDPSQKAALERNLLRNRYLLADLPGFAFTPPTLTFSGTMTLRGSDRSVELTTVEHGHTPEECYLAVSGTKIVFTGDLAFFACPPFIARDSSLDGWLEKLDMLMKSEFETFVPGHGPLGTRQDLQRQKEYLLTMRELVSTAVNKGLSKEQILGVEEPRQFASWGTFTQRHENNLASLYELLK